MGSVAVGVPNIQDRPGLSGFTHVTSEMALVTWASLLGAKWGSLLFLVALA